MSRAKAYILWFKEIRIKDVPLVGGKNAALGEMYQHLTKSGVNVPNGFAVTAAAYRYFLERTGLKKQIRSILQGLDPRQIKDLQKRGALVRQAILAAKLPKDLEQAILKAYAGLAKFYGRIAPDVAVRSSATAEDLPDASFAGQQETYLNVAGPEHLLEAVKKCMASLFTDRAISYRHDKGFSQFAIALSVGVQKMVRSDLAASGVMFTIDTETGFDQTVLINGIYGLGELIVQGIVTPDEFVVFKPTLGKVKNSIINKKLGRKNVKLVYQKNGTKKIGVLPAAQEKYCLTEREILRLAGWGVQIENYFSKVRKHYQPMDIEWAKDGRTKELFIVQARPETVQALASKRVYKEYRLQTSGKTLLTGIAVGSRIGSGRVKVIKSPKEISKFKKGDILVSEITDPDWEPIMKLAAAIITDKGGRTSHAAIVSRELGIPCAVGTRNATQVLKDGMPVTVDSSSGTEAKIYQGLQKFTVIEHNLKKIPKTRTGIMVNIGSPDDAFINHYLPVRGVGLGRLEFIIASEIQVHPSALLNYHNLSKRARADTKLAKLVRQIDALTVGYPDKTKYYIDKLSYGIALIGAAFWPNHVIIRFSDFKTNEYRTLLGGKLFEPHEENPMLGWRGASRYYDGKFEKAFALECRAVEIVRKRMGLTNVIPMVPFCRTPEEGQNVVEVMAQNGLSRTRDKELKIYVMCEIPSNVLLAEEFLRVFDGMSIGSNDLTQLVMGLDRDSGIVTKIANENNPAVKKMISDVIAICRKHKKYIGICGQAPSDFPEFVEFLIKNRIDTISLNPDTVLKTIMTVHVYEKGLRK